MKKLNPQSAIPILFVAVLFMFFGGGRLAAVGDRIGAELANSGNSQAAETDNEGSSSCDWRSGQPHKMHWPQWPDLGYTGIDVAMPLVSLADDFKCMANGPINDIHIWGSFADDVLPEAEPASLTFELSIYTNIPATENTPSMPGDLLWTRTFSPGEYSVRMVHDGPEDWYDPVTELYLPDNHRGAYQYNFCIEEEPFIQKEGTVYWLGVKELGSADANYIFGWKTTTRELGWNDDAVYTPAGELTWSGLTYPKEHDYETETLNLAFVITGGEEGRGKHDLGDAPDSSNSFPGAQMLAYPATGVVANYPTVYWTDSAPYGPIHWQPEAMVYLGSSVTSEGGADHGYDEDLKNNLYPPDDSSDLDGGDDGVRLPLVLPHCGEATIDFTATFIYPLLNLPAFVNVWCDWNRDGDWDDTIECPDGVIVPEWAVQNAELTNNSAGSAVHTTPSFMCWHPQTEGEPDPMWMRITISLKPWEPVAGAALTGGSGPADGYLFGETEDYFIYPRKEAGALEYDWSDAPDSVDVPGYPTLSANSGANHVIAGPWLGDEKDSPDAEPDGQPESTALGDDSDGNDDENGVTVPPLIRGETADISLDVRGGSGIVQGWIDFNGDGTWEAAEEIYSGFLTNGPHIISFSVPTDAVLGQTFARFRISRDGGLGPDGPALDGEVEDYAVVIEDAPDNIKWVQWPDLTRNGIDICVDCSDNRYRRIADDFECTSYSRVTKVTIWGSWKDDNKGKIKAMNLRFYSDDPPGPEGEDPENRFSKPGSEPLWKRHFIRNEIQETLYHVVRAPGEWWWDPVTGEYGPGGDTEVWRIDIYIEPDEAFLQHGSPDNPVIYWLEVNVDPPDDTEFGWKTRQWPDHFMDDAVWDTGINPPHDWKELYYPKTHPYYSLEQNSIDMAFELTFTEEPPPQPTFRPVSATQCPVVETQCPTVATQCPPVNTQCPAVGTQCPAIDTECPPAETRCPPVDTKCPAEDTKCPAIETECPPVDTKCPAEDTKCPVVETQCPAIDTECPPAETRCPPVDTKCPAEDTKCPTVETKCPPVRTKCPGELTECPPVSTRCPAIHTLCPPVDTECPLTDTQCPPADTSCPPVDTQCPPADTTCPPVDTQCPAVDTSCPLVDTQCPPVDTSCPPVNTQCPPVVPTQCPAAATSCPPVDTQCPTVDTRCPPSDTKCPAVDTSCPPSDTKCPAVDTSCPPSDTKCPVVDTSCPPSDTKCPAVDTSCPPSDTKCPAVDTSCPPSDTKCPAVDTTCPPSDTKCPPSDTSCPPVDTQCPPAETMCPPVDTQCPYAPTTCPPVQTQCPAVDTKCPPAETQCPPIDTRCPPVDTQCPAVDTSCPPSETKCPTVDTSCPPSATKCPPSTTSCPPEITQCEGPDTICPPSETKCPPIQTRCPPMVTECFLVDTQCPSLETRCPPVDTECPALETRCPPVDTECPVSATKCPPAETNCPPLDTRCPPSDTKCPILPTLCPPMVTECFLVDTQCPSLETRCPPVDTECPSAFTNCPPLETECPQEETRCPLGEACPISTGIYNPARALHKAIENEPLSVNIRSLYEKAECPAINTQCPTVITVLPEKLTRFGILYAKKGGE
jgi:hypothetical protein